MEIRISYCKQQLEKVVNYIAEHSEFYKGQHEYIRSTIISTIHEMALEASYYLTASMGFVIHCDKFYENFDRDENHAEFEIWIDPAVLNCNPDDMEWHQEILSKEDE